MVVTREQLEASIQRLEAEVADPRAGIYGPETMAWRINRESVVFLAGGRAALLQLAHPAVAYAIAQHSNTKQDPLGRFQRTFHHVFLMAFGDLAHAVGSARRVHAIHQRIYGQLDDGTGYVANDGDALHWVHATLVDSAVRAFEDVMGSLPIADKDRYLAETRRFASLFGIPDTILSPNWHAHVAYMHRMNATLRVTQPAREIAHFLLDQPLPQRWLLPAMRLYRALTIGLLPPTLRHGFGFTYNAKQARLHHASLAVLRRTYPRLPVAVRWVPAYQDALERIGQPADMGQVGPHFTRWLQNAVLSR